MGNRRLRSSLPAATAVTLSVLLAGLLAGCGGSAEPPPGDRIDTARMRAVAEDEDATAHQIVRAGSAVDAADSDGTALVTFTVHQGTSEGRSAAAWRLYDPEGATIASELAGVTHEGAATAHVVSVADGYLVRDADGPVWHVSVDGTREKVTREGGLVPAQAGDVPLDDGSTRLYRPGTRTLFTPAPRATGNRQGWTVGDDGTLWLQRLGRSGRIPFSRSTGAGTWEPVAPYTPDAGNSVKSVTAVGEHVVVPVVAEGQDLTKARLVGLLVRRSGAPAEQTWELLDATDVGGTEWWDVHTMVVDAITVAVGSWGSAPYLVDLTTGTWERMPAPTDEHGWVYEFEDGRVYANHRDHADAWLSENRGESWSRLPH